MVSQEPTTRLVLSPDEKRDRDMSRLGGGELLDGRYELLDLLGQGGMATVYRARDHRLGRLVAIKILDDHGTSGTGIMLREDRVLARLAHPHIVGVYDSGTLPDGRSFLVLELIEGEPTSHLAPLPVDRALRIAEQVASALAYAHAQGVVHCDLKPQNVLLDARGEAKLTDFGVASADAAPVGAMVYGSAAYLAPERLRGAPTSPAVDIYALGATLYFLLTGRPPQGGDGAKVIPERQGLEATTPLTPPIPVAVAALVQRALAPDPAERFPSSAAFGDALAAVRSMQPQDTRTTRMARATAPKGWHRGALMAALVGLLLVGLLSAAALTRSAPGATETGAAGGDPQPVATAELAIPTTPAPGEVSPAPSPAGLPVGSTVPLAVPTTAAIPTAPPAAPAVVQPQPAAPSSGGKGKEKEGDRGKEQDGGKP